MVRRIPYSDYKVKQEIPVIDSYKFDNVHNASSLHRRIVRKRFATKVEFTQSGKIGKSPEITLLMPTRSFHFNPEGEGGSTTIRRRTLRDNIFLDQFLT